MEPQESYRLLSYVNRFAIRLAQVRYLLHDKTEFKGWEGHRRDVVEEDIVINPDREKEKRRDR